MFRQRLYFLYDSRGTSEDLPDSIRRWNQNRRQHSDVPVGSKEPHSSSSWTNTPARPRRGKHCWDVAQRWLRRVSNFSNCCQSTDTQSTFIGTRMIQSVVLLEELRVTWRPGRGIPTIQGERVMTVETTAETKSRGANYPTTKVRPPMDTSQISFFLPASFISFPTHCIGHVSLELLRNCWSCVFGGRTLE